MDGIAYNQIFILFLQCLIVAVLLLSLFKLRSIFGLGLLFTALGVFQYMQVFLVNSLYIEILPDVLVSPGSMVLFTASIFAILLIYIREDAIEARKVIYALVAANLALSILQLVFSWSLEGEGVHNINNIPMEFFSQNALILLVGTPILFIDAFAIILIYEAISRFVSSLFFRILFSTVLILSFDSLLFALFTYGGNDQFSNVLVSSLLAKNSAAILYTCLFTLYLIYIDKGYRKNETNSHSYQDIFNSLTYRQKFEKVYAEKEIQDIKFQNSEEYNRLLFDTSPTGLALSKMDGTLVDINPAYAKIIGKTIDETLKLSYWDITPEKYSSQEAEQLKSLEEKGSYGPYEKEYIHSDGQFVPVLLKGLIIEREGEKYIWSSVEDRTVSKQAAEMIVESERKYKNLIELTNDIIYICDKDGNYTFLNDAGYKALKVTPNEIIGVNWKETINKDDWEKSFEAFKEMLKNNTDLVNYENRLVSKNGKEINVIHNVRIIKNEKGMPIGLQGIARDITNRKKIQTELKKHRAHLEEIVVERTQDLKKKST
jgi:PAS domain S-box-containing protein